MDTNIDHIGSGENTLFLVMGITMDLGVEGTEHVEGTTSPRDVFPATRKTATA